ELEEVPGIGEKTLEKIGTAVRHYFAELDNRAAASPVGESSAQEDDNEAALDREAGAGSNSLAADEISDGAGIAESEETDVPIGEVPGEGAILDTDDSGDIAAGAEQDDEQDIAQLVDAESANDSDTLAAKLLGWKIDIKSEEEKRQEVEQQMQAMAGPVTTPIEQVTELGEGTIQKLITAGITTVEGLADMTPEQLEEVPGIGEKTLEKIGTAVRHYFAELDNRAAAGPVGESSAQEDENEAALDREAGAGSDSQAADEISAEGEGEAANAGEADVPVGDAPGEVPILEAAEDADPSGFQDIDQVEDTDSPDEGDTLAADFLKDATGTEDVDGPVSIDAPEAREPELDRWEEKEKP
ncbi:MAG: helix-hairpin-helix domain-containing protein, partial [Acidobacteriaceae bacterium]